MSENETRLALSPWQRKLVGAALTAMALAVLVLCAGLLFRGVAAFLKHFQQVLWPLALALLLTLTLRPAISFMESRLRMSRPLAVLAMWLLTLGVGVGFAALVLPQLVVEVFALTQVLAELIDSGTQLLHAHLPRLAALLDAQGVSDALGEGARSLLSWLFSNSTGLVQAGKRVISWGATVASACLIPVYLTYFLLLERDVHRDFARQLQVLPEKWRTLVLRLVDDFMGIMVTFLRGQVLVGLATGTLLAIGFSLVGVHMGLLLGLLLGLLNLIPYLGTGIGLLVLIPLTLFQDGGGVERLLYALGVLGIVQTVESYLISPRILEQGTGLHPAALIVAVIFWGVAFDGVLGMMLGVPLTAFMVGVWRILRDAYLKPSDTPEVA